VNPAQVHAQQQVGPVLSLGATGAGLDIEGGAVGVHFAAAHAAELQPFKNAAQTVQLDHHIVDRASVVFLDGHIQQITGVSQAAMQLVQGLYDLGQGGTLTTQVLGVFGVVPDVGVFEFAVYFDETIMLVIVVKDTPESTGCARTGP